MKDAEVIWSEGNNDECYTPSYGVYPIIKHIDSFHKYSDIGKNLDRDLIVWCPFDTKDSEFVKQISKMNSVKVEYSHIFEGKDFFNYEPKEWDIIVSNPPFKGKRQIFERALSFNKPFALIMTNTWLNDSAPKQLFKDKELQLLMFDKRMKFISPNGVINNKITFSCSYYCYNFLEKQVIMESLDEKK